MLLDQLIFILWLFLLTEIMRKTLDPTASPKDSLDGNISRSVDDHNGQGHQEESEILGNFQLKEITKSWEGI